MKFSLTAQIEEVDRELDIRRRVYPSQVKSRAMTQGAATFHISRLERVRETLLWQQQHETEIREIMAARRKAAGQPLELEILEHAESVEVQFSDGRRSEYFYFDDDAQGVCRVPRQGSVEIRPATTAADRAYKRRFRLLRKDPRAMTLRPFTTELRKQGFALAFRDRGGGTTCTQFNKRQGDRELHVQLWAHGVYRVSHGTYDRHGLRETTRPTDFSTVGEMRLAIELEWIRPSTDPESRKNTRPDQLPGSNPLNVLPDFDRG